MSAAKVSAERLQLLVLATLRDWAGGQGLSGRAVAELTDLSPTCAIKYLCELERSGVVARVRCGRSDIWNLEGR